MKRGNNASAGKITGSVITIVALAVCFVITSFALVWSSVSEENNLFHTGEVKIDLNGGKPVIEEHEFLFEPGMTVVKDFYLENQSTWDVWYRLYFENVEGGLGDVLEVSVKDGETVLWSGKLSEMTKDRTAATADALKLGERKELTIWFHFPESAGNEAQGLSLSFSLAADAVQTKNNPNKLFD